MSAGRHAERGSSLLEVTLALGLMAGVLGSIAGLFVLGAGEVRSGRNASTALAVARSVVEVLQGADVRQLPLTLGCDVDEGGCVVDSTSAVPLAVWQAQLDAKLPGARLTVTLTPLEADAPALESSRQLRMVVTVRWSEGSRARRVRLGTVRS